MTIEKKTGKEIRSELKFMKITGSSIHEINELIKESDEREWVAVSDLQTATLQELLEFSPAAQKQLREEHLSIIEHRNKEIERVVGWANTLEEISEKCRKESEETNEVSYKLLCNAFAQSLEKIVREMREMEEGKP